NHSLPHFRQILANITIPESSYANDITGAGVFCLDLLQPFVSEKGGHTRPVPALIAVYTDNRITHGYATTNDSADGDATEVIAVMKVRDQHLKIGVRRNGGRRNVLYDRFEQWRQILVVVVQLAHRKTIL